MYFSENSLQKKIRAHLNVILLSQHQETIRTELQPRLALPVGQKWNYSHALATGRYGTTLIYDDPIHV
jgi:hypothetical protein